MLAENLLSDSNNLVRKAWAVVGKFLALEPNEESFMSAVQNGELLTELIFPGAPEEARRIAGHPAIRWKIEILAHFRHSLHFILPIL